MDPQILAAIIIAVGGIIAALIGRSLMVRPRTDTDERRNGEAETRKQGERSSSGAGFLVVGAILGAVGGVICYGVQEASPSVKEMTDEQAFVYVTIAFVMFGVIGGLIGGCLGKVIDLLMRR